MRATCDTNILVRAAVRPTGPARAVFVELLSDEHMLLVSAHIITEVARVLRYERVRMQAELTAEQIDAFVLSYVNWRRWCRRLMSRQQLSATPMTTLL